MAVLARCAPYAAASGYALVVGAAVRRHEPWADEAQAWLLARDTSLVDLWTRLLHYEGSPGLWHTLLHALIRLGLPYSGLNVVSAVLGLAAVCLLLKAAPLPLGIRLFLPFTYYLCYQYAVVARSYDTLPLLLFACAILFENASKHLELLTCLLVLMAAVSVHGFVLSLSITVALCASGTMALRSKRLLAAGFIYVIALAVLAAAAWPASDVTFVTHRNLSVAHLIEVSAGTFRQAFTGEWITSVATVALTIPFLWRGKGLLVFLLSSALLCSVGAVVYAQVWHQGLLFLAWLFAIWIAAQNTRVTAGVTAVLGIVSTLQCYWTVRSINYDWVSSYSGSRKAARFLQQADIPDRALYGIGFSCTAIQPYFNRNLFSNWGGGETGPAYWDWSSRNHVNDASGLLSSRTPEYVMVGYKEPSERFRWANLAEMGGYQAIQHFDGNLFWRNAVFEPEAFDLYRRAPNSNRKPVASILNTADPSIARQLLSGFYGIENNAWRWSSRQFAVALQPPPGAERTGAKLLLHLSIPDAQIQKLGPITVSADVDGHGLSSQTFGQSGNYVYSQNVPADKLRSGIVPVTFTLDKAVAPSKADERELGAVVSQIALRRQ